MSPEDLCAELEARGVVLSAEAGKLRVNAPRGTLSDTLRDAIQQNRDQILCLVERRAAAAQGSIPQILRDRSTLPVSGFQRRLWILQRMYPDLTDYNIVAIWRDALQASPETHRAAIERLLERHEILHSSFDEHNEVLTMSPLPVQRVEITTTDTRTPSGTAMHEMVMAQVEREAHRPFDLTAGPAVRFLILRLSNGHTVTLCVCHHIIVDDWSLSLLQSEFECLCTADLTSSREEPAPSMRLQYADYAAWEQSQLARAETAAELGWWNNYLAGAPPLSIFPADIEGTDNPAGAMQEYSWDRQLATGLGALVRANNATLYAALLAAGALVLRWHTGQKDFIVGSPMGIRERAELESIIGPFVGLLLVRLDVTGDPGFAEMLRRAQNSMLDAHAHRHVAFEALLEHLKPPRELAHSPLFQMAIVQHNAPGESRNFTVNGGATHEITWYMRETDEGLLCNIEYRSDLYSSAAIDRIASHLEAVLRRAVEDPQQPFSTLIRPTADELRLLESFNDTAVARADDTFIAAFERSAARAADSVAVVYEGDSLTYRELDRRAAALATCLHSRGAARGERVAVCMDRSLTLVVALLAVQKTGAAYVPLDPSFPAERLRFMIEDSEAAILLANGPVPAVLSGSLGNIVTLDCSSTPSPADSPDVASMHPAPTDPAYIIYTSGSTGQPKGVMVSHGSLLNLLRSMEQRPGLHADDVFAAVTTISFDIAALEIYLPLLVGARIALLSRQVAADAVQLAAAVRASGTTIMQATPTTWRMLIAASCEFAQGFRAWCGGEALPRELADGLLSRVGELWNLYGPTETTIWSSACRVGRDGPISIGTPIDNTRLYVVGEAGQLQPIGGEGEICIGGAGVAIGYWKRPELTAERFLADAFDLRPGSRLYRTGDRGRWLANGDIEHRGRLDHQVKIRGYRVEVGEIEHLLGTHESVRQAVVAAREAAPGDLRLVAYIIYEPGQDLTVSEVRAHLRRSLPDYMIPSLVVGLDSMPVTPNGKIDRAVLPDPFKRAHVPARIDGALTTPAEKMLGDFWRELLKIDQIGAEDNFFELGGHSLLTLRFAVAVEKRTGWRPDPRTLYFQSLRQIAATMAGHAVQGIKE